MALRRVCDAGEESLHLMLFLGGVFLVFFGGVGGKD